MFESAGSDMHSCGYQVKYLLHQVFWSWSIGGQKCGVESRSKYSLRYNMTQIENTRSVAPRSAETVELAVKEEN
jgi:hypothetical protein